MIFKILNIWIFNKLESGIDRELKIIRVGALELNLAKNISFQTY